MKHPHPRNRVTNRFGASRGVLQTLSVLRTYVLYCVLEGVSANAALSMRGFCCMLTPLSSEYSTGSSIEPGAHPICHKHCIQLPARLNRESNQSSATLSTQ